jgi:OOP family OmpA-OmpF porin
MKVGERTVWVEPGPWAAIAGVGVMHGNTPQELRQLFKEILEQIHLERQDALESFEGDSSPFEVCQPLLERCLQARYREGEDDKKKKMPLVFWVILAVLVLVGGYWLYSRSDERSRWDDYLQTLENVPGIVITKITKEDGQYRIAGMRDPLAVDPQTLLEHSSLDPAKVAAEWEFYQSVHPSLVLARAEALLAPPSEVRLRFDAGVLAGIGRAPHQWIVTAQRLAPSLGGVERLDLANLIDTDLGRLDALQEAIRNYTVYFEFDSVRVAPDQITKIDSLAKDIRAFYEAARRAQVEFYIEVVGHTDGSSGSLNLNMIFSRLRAEEVLRELRQRNLVLVPWLAVGKAYQEQVLEERQVKDRALNRRVTADVVYTDRPAPF